MGFQKFIIGVLVLVVILGGIYIFGAFSSNPINTAGVIDNKPSDNQATLGTSATGAIKEFTMTAKQYEFDPNTITVNLGDTVILHITSEDVKHGIALPDFGVSKDINPGEETTVEFVADKKGTFSFFCNVYCGAGHREMTGTLIVN